MSGRQQQVAVFSGLRGRDGRTGSPMDIPLHKARECLNVDFYRTAYARKRGGALSQSLAGSGFGPTSRVSSLHRHVPGADSTQGERWAVAQDETACQLARHPPGPGPWTPITWASPITHGYQWYVNWVSFNGKLYILANSDVDRLQVYDPATSPTALRFAGLAPPAAPTVQNMAAAGSYPATPRWYRVTYTWQASAGISIRRSNASAATAFTPTGANAGALVLKPASLGEGETHWEVYGAAAETGPFYFLQRLPVTTPTMEDGLLPANYYQQITLMPLQGDHTAPWSARFGIADDNRLLLAGAYEGGHSHNEVWFSPVLGSTSPLFADDERLPAKNKISFNERDGGYITGLGGPIGSSVVVFKNNQTWRLVPTGDVDDPYRRRLISRVVGCIQQKTVVAAEDELGTPTIYWLSAQGPYRFNLSTGLARLTWDIQDIWDRVNVNGAVIVAHGVWVPDRHQVWWWVAVDGQHEPTTTKIVYDTHLGRVVDAGKVQDGWSVHDGPSANARCSALFENSDYSLDLKPHIGYTGAYVSLWKCDTPDQSDNGTPVRAGVWQPHRHLAGLDHRCQVGTPAVLAAAGGATVTVEQLRDYGETTRSATVSLVPAGTETRVLRVAEGVETADAVCVALAVGDPWPVTSAWTIDALLQPYEVREPVVL